MLPKRPEFEMPSFLGTGKVVTASSMAAPVGDIDEMDVDELLALKDQIEGRLPNRSLKAMNLEEELVEQYMKVKALQNRVLNDEGIPANQLAQCAGQVASTLQALVRMQTEWYNAERFKDIESHLIKTLNKLPAEMVEDFFTWYEDYSGNRKS